MAIRTACRLCPLRNGFSTSKYGSVSKWSWQCARRADYAHSAMAFRHQKYGSVSKWSWQCARRADYAHSAMAFRHQKYGSVSKWSWQCARRADYAHSAMAFQHQNTEVYRSGHNGPHSKCGNGVTRSWVRIPPLPPIKT